MALGDAHRRYQPTQLSAREQRGEPLSDHNEMRLKC